MNEEERLNLNNYIESLYQAMQIGDIKFEPKHSSELYNLINKLLEENQQLKEKLEVSEKARKELENKINKTNDYINKNPLVCVGDYEYFVNDIMQMESFSNKMSFIRTLKENLDIDKGE